MPNRPMPPRRRLDRRALTTTLALLGFSWLVACNVRDLPKTVPPSGASKELLNPDPVALAAPAPDSFTIVFTTSKGEIEVLLHRDWSPLGVDRLHYLASHGFFDGARFFRVVPGFIVQFGLSGRPDVDDAFRPLAIDDDPVKVTNRRGTLVFATSGPNTRTTQLFINLNDNAMLDPQGFSPMGEVVRGMDIVDQLNPEYGEMPVQSIIEREGNAYLREQFPALDSITRVTVGPPPGLSPP
jgi:peptidyl-prolyl cis-trans isomerase A (cyclophilin A)